jgi:GNAT superfamily N-acetyltransferase
VELRKATPADGAAIAAVHVASWRKIYDGVLDPATLAELDEADLTREWTAAIEHPGSPEVHVWVLEDDGDVIGYARTGPTRDEYPDNGVFEIYGFYTHPSVWGTGAGAVMMDGVLDDFRRRGVETATLWVVRDNPRARRFYEKHGWAHEPGPTNTCFGAPEVRYRTTPFSRKESG